MVALVYKFTRKERRRNFSVDKMANLSTYRNQTGNIHERRTRCQTLGSGEDYGKPDSTCPF